MAELKFIGRVHSTLKNVADCPLQESESTFSARIEIYEPFAEGAKDMKEGDGVILFTWLNLADRSTLLTLPRNNVHAKLTGVFSTRSPDRPNPIGIHFVKVTSVLPDNSFEVDGLEVLDQTPLLDIKYGMIK